MCSQVCSKVCCAYAGCEGWILNPAACNLSVSPSFSLSPSFCLSLSPSLCLSLSLSFPLSLSLCVLMAGDDLETVSNAVYDKMTELDPSGYIPPYHSSTCTANHITSHHITSHHITSHHITSYMFVVRCNTIQLQNSHRMFFSVCSMSLLILPLSLSS